MFPLHHQYTLVRTLEVPQICPLPSIRSERAATVAKWFGIDDLIDHPKPPVLNLRKQRTLLRTLVPDSRQITFFTGPSGAGKSSMLRALQQFRRRTTFVDLNRISLAEVPLVDCFEQAPLDQTLALLAQVGLAEAWTYLRTPGELSEGQRWRLRLALGMRRAQSEMRCRNQADGDNAKPHRVILLIDEFGALLDRVTAAIVARCLRRAITATPNLGAAVATSHEDLTGALCPDTIVHCDFQLIEIRKRTS